MKKLLLTGTFAPPTLGHLDIIERGSKLCEKLFVAIGENISKRGEQVLSLEERLALLKTLTKKYKNVEVCSFSGLAAQFAKKMDLQGIVRGLRTLGDFTYEMQMALANRKLGIETIFLIADPRYSHISSSLVRDLIFFRGDLKEFVPKEVERALYRKIG